MPRAYRHLTWRVVDPDPEKTSSSDGELQTLAPTYRLDDAPRFRWVTVARGNSIDLTEIAKALNGARFSFHAIPRNARRKR